MITFFLMNLIVAWSAFLLTYRVFKISAAIDSLLAFFILYLAQIISAELILGITGALYLNNIILLNLTILLFIWLAVRRKNSSFDLRNIKDSLLIIPHDRVAFFVLSVILAFGVAKIFVNLINPPFGWDSLNYHFTFPVEWLKHGNLDTPITVFDDPGPCYYPINGSLFYLWLMIPFRNVFLADLGQIPFFVLGFLSVYNISRKISLDKRLAFFAASLFLLIPNFFKQLQVAYVDVMVAGLFLVCVNYLFLLSRDFSWQNALIYSMGFGLLLGTKTVALPYCILLFIPFVYLLLKNLNKAHLLIVSIFIIIALGGFAYLRNFIQTANPFYPLDFELLGKVVFKGPVDIATYRAHCGIEDYQLGKILFHEGLGSQSLVFILPSIFLTLPIAIAKRRKGLSFILGYCIILPIPLWLIYRYVIPMPNLRYLYPLLGIGVVSGFYLADTLNIKKNGLNILIAICTLTSMAELAKRQELIVAVILTPLLFLLFLKGIFRLAKPITKPVYFVVSFLLMICALIFLENWYIKNEYPRFTKMVKYSGFWPDATRAWEWLNDNTAGNNIAYVGRPVPFPLYGTGFKNNVFYVSVNKTQPAKLHYFPNGHYRWGYDFLELHQNLAAEGNYRSGADYSFWLDNLQKTNTDYLFIYSLHQTKNVIFPVEDFWARANPGKFNLVFLNDTVRIYRILR